MKSLTLLSIQAFNSSSPSRTLVLWISSLFCLLVLSFNFIKKIDMIFFYLFALTICILFINKFLLKKKILISETGDIHQKFASKSMVPLTGGLFIFLG